MASVAEIAIPLAEICVPVPRAGEGVCRVCHGFPQPPRTDLCWSCQKVSGQLTHPCPLVVPISLTTKTGSQLYHFLKRYKSQWSSTDYASLRVAALFAYFMTHHSDCIDRAAGGEFDIITVVPSSGEREGAHPMLGTLRRIVGLEDRTVELLKRGPGALGFNQASDDGFVPMRDVQGQRALIVDDTYTTGARAQSAASALTIAGATVTAIVPIGRLISPDFGETAPYWERQSGIPFSFSTCCLE